MASNKIENRFSTRADVSPQDASWVEFLARMAGQPSEIKGASCDLPKSQLLSVNEEEKVRDMLPAQRGAFLSVWLRSALRAQDVHQIDRLLMLQSRWLLRGAALTEESATMRLWACAFSADHMRTGSTEQYVAFIARNGFAPPEVFLGNEGVVSIFWVSNDGGNPKNRCGAAFRLLEKESVYAQARTDLAEGRPEVYRFLLRCNTAELYRLHTMGQVSHVRSPALANNPAFYWAATGMLTKKRIDAMIKLGLDAWLNEKNSEEKSPWDVCANYLEKNQQSRIYYEKKVIAAATTDMKKKHHKKRI